MERVYEDDLDSVPEPDHVAQVMDGFIDTVSGSESFTKAQHYLEGVLFSNGIIRHRDVGGTEGILGKIADGAKAALEYIQKLFRSIWDFFFKSEKKKLEDKVDKALTELEKDLDAMEKTNVTPANADAALKKVDTAVNKLQDGPEKTKLKEKVKEAQESKDDKHKAQVAETMPGEVFKAYFISPVIHGTIERKMNNLVKALDRLKGEKPGSGKLDLTDEIQTIQNGMIGYPESVTEIKDAVTANKYVSTSRRCHTAMKNSLSSVENLKSTFQSRIDEVKKEGGDAEKRKTELLELKQGLVTITAVIKMTQEIMEHMVSLSKTVSNACVVVI